MGREYKCHYCKEILDNEFVEFTIGKTKTQKKRSHFKCRQNVLDKHEFYKLLYDILEVPTLTDKRIFQNFDELNKKGYQWNVMTYALKCKIKDIKLNLDKGIFYCLAIIRNYLPTAYQKVQEEKNSKPVKIIQESNVEEIIINIPKQQLDNQSNIEIEF